MLQCAAAVVQSQEQPHLNRRLQTGGMKTEAETKAAAASSKTRLELGDKVSIGIQKKGGPF